MNKIYPTDDERFNWDLSSDDYDGPQDLGEIVEDFYDKPYELECDNALCEILNWEKVPIDDLGDNWVLAGICKGIAVFQHVKNLSYDKNYEYLIPLEISEDSPEFSALINWGREKRNSFLQEESKQERIEALLKEHGLDDETINKKRSALLKEHGFEG